MYTIQPPYIRGIVPMHPIQNQIFLCRVALARISGHEEDKAREMSVSIRIEIS